MDEIFSCRNCVNDCGQSLLIGVGAGFCIRHNSILLSPERTTCKYLHRKDLPSFVVDEGVREHAGEFAEFSGLVDLYEVKPMPSVRYSEKWQWENRDGHRVDTINLSLSQYHKAKPAWIFLQSMAGGIDGRRKLTHASLVRRYMSNCDTWKSSYRFVLALIDGIADEIAFGKADLNPGVALSFEDQVYEAKWDVFFNKLSGVQEYGFHAGIEELRWATDGLGENLAILNWSALAENLPEFREKWITSVVEHARKGKAFFTQTRRFEEDDEG